MNWPSNKAVPRWYGRIALAVAQERRLTGERQLCPISGPCQVR